MQDKKQIIGLILSVVLSVGLVVVGVNAATTVGNAVSVGTTLTVTGTSTMNGDVLLGNAAADVIVLNGTLLSNTAFTSTTVTGTSTMNGAIILGNAAADSIFLNGTLYVNTAFASTTVTATTTLNGDVLLGNAAADVIVLNGTLLVNTAFASTTVTATTTLNGDVSLGDTSADNITITGTVSAATGITASSVTTTLLSVGGGLAISKLYSTSTALDFGAIAALACATSSTSLTGVAPGDVVVLGMAQEIAGATTTVSWNAWVPVANFVYVRVCNVGSSGPTPNFSPGTVRIDVWQH